MMTMMGQAKELLVLFLSAIRLFIIRGWFVIGSTLHT